MKEKIAAEDAAAVGLAPDAQPAGQRKRARKRKAGPKSLKEDIRGALVSIGVAWGGLEALRQHPEPTCGQTLADQAEQIATALDLIAADDIAVYNFLRGMLEGGGWGALAFAVFPLFQAIIASHVVPGIERRRAAREAALEEVKPWPSSEDVEEPE